MFAKYTAQRSRFWSVNTAQVVHSSTNAKPQRPYTSPTFRYFRCIPFLKEGNISMYNYITYLTCVLSCIWASNQYLWGWMYHPAVLEHNQQTSLLSASYLLISEDVSLRNFWGSLQFRYVREYKSRSGTCRQWQPHKSLKLSLVGKIWSRMRQLGFGEIFYIDWSDVTLRVIS